MNLSLNKNNSIVYNFDRHFRHAAAFHLIYLTSAKFYVINKTEAIEIAG